MASAELVESRSDITVAFVWMSRDSLDRPSDRENATAEAVSSFLDDSGDEGGAAADAEADGKSSSEAVPNSSSRARRGRGGRWWFREDGVAACLRANVESGEQALISG
mmetsp:Transcript_1158/g.2572  ORF Transcript_1158/g.2572 Transcript_1158/m.2572 type:complete len:108 (+) Transcript_1158:178-501(+)